MKKKKTLYLTLFVAFLLSFLAFADDPYIGIWINPYALSDYKHDHKVYISHFKDFVDAAKDNGIDTIVFHMDSMAYHWQGDAKLKNLTYHPGRGFTPAEVQEMAEYVRSRDMRIVVAMEILSHMEFNAFPYAYPGYMINEGAWATGRPYKGRSDFVENGGNTYQCRKTHISKSSTKPGTAGGASYWRVKGRSARNPFDEDGEDLIFDMINELITVFTVYGQKPEGFCIESDEAYSWLKLELNDYRNTGNLDYAEAYAMAINNAYNYIHDEIDPNMDVIMAGDMLDPIVNGGTYQTSDATDYITTDVIILDWLYNLSWYRYDFQAGLFPSVQELIDKGFKVITASWKEVEPTKALIWTANMAEAGKPGSILGHFYTIWVSAALPQLSYALVDPADSRIKNKWLSAIGESIDASINLIGAKQCTQNDTSFGTYPNCNNANDFDGIWGTEYRDYYYNPVTSSLAYYIVDLPCDPVSYWDFEGDAGDRAGNNDGKLVNGAAIVMDPVRGQVVNLDGVNDYVAVPDSSSLDMTGALTVSCWFNLDDVPADFSKRVVLLGKHCTEYELRLYDGGKLMALSSNGAKGFEVGVSSWNPVRNWVAGRWYHAAWVMDGREEYLYIDGELMGFETRKRYDGTKAGTHDFNIGRCSPSGGFYVDGRMDDVMVFDRALSPAEIRYLYLTQEL